MPRLGPPVVNPQKQPVVVSDQVASRSPNAVVFVRAIASPLSNQTNVIRSRCATMSACSARAWQRRWERTQRPLAVVIVLDWRELAGFSGCDGKKPARAAIAAAMRAKTPAATRSSRRGRASISLTMRTTRRCAGSNCLATHVCTCAVGTWHSGPVPDGRAHAPHLQHPGSWLPE